MTQHHTSSIVDRFLGIDQIQSVYMSVKLAPRQDHTFLSHVSEEPLHIRRVRNEDPNLGIWYNWQQSCLRAGSEVLQG